VRSAGRKKKNIALGSQEGEGHKNPFLFKTYSVLGEKKGVIQLSSYLKTGTEQKMKGSPPVNKNGEGGVPERGGVMQISLTSQRGAAITS